MGWKFWQRRVNPLDSENLRDLEKVALAGDLAGAAREIKKIRNNRGDTSALRYLEALVYHGGRGAAAADLQGHLAPALEPVEGQTFPEARLLAAELAAAMGNLDDATFELDALLSVRLKPELKRRVNDVADAVHAIASGGTHLINGQAEGLASELSPLDLTIRWRLSDLARLDSLLDCETTLGSREQERLIALAGEIVVRARAGQWRLAPRPEDRAVLIDGHEWQVGAAVHDRVQNGTPLYAAAHRALGTPFTTVDGVPGVEVVVEPNVHPTVVVDHIARVLFDAGASGLGVFRERPTPEGPVRLPLSFVDKSNVARVLYVETRPWDADRVTELKRWVWRLRASTVRDALVSVVSADTLPRDARELVKLADGSPSIPGLPNDALSVGARAATPRSLDEPKLRWLDEKAEVMESLIRATMGDGKPSELEIVRKMQDTVVGGLNRPASELSAKQWNALYGYGALYARVLARSTGARWTRLADDAQPSHWEMVLGSGATVRPLGAVMKVAQLGIAEADLVAHYIAAKSERIDRSQNRDVEVAPATPSKTDRTEAPLG